MTKVTKEQVIMAILREISLGREVLIGSDVAGGSNWVMTEESKAWDLIRIYESELLEDEVACWFIDGAEAYDPSKPCYTLLHTSGKVIQVNINL